MLTGDCRDLLRQLPDESVHCVVTSPPYWGLRDYGTAKWEGGDAGCDHSAIRRNHNGEKQETSAGTSRDRIIGRDCHCGATRIDSQLGLEPDFNAYVAAMVEVFREVRRVLRKDGTLWLNLGDSYSGGGGFSPDAPSNQNGSKQTTQGSREYKGRQPAAGLKPKDLCGIPWRVAFALQADGWYLRQDIIWSKPNPMPESVTDRCTKAHEYLFLLTKAPRYFYDAEAIAEDITGHARGSGNHSYRYDGMNGHETKQGLLKISNTVYPSRNKRSVWEVTTAPFSEAHFATFPPALIEPCIKAGTSERGCCSQCGAPWVRQINKTTEFRGGSGAAGRTAEDANASGKWAGKQYGTNIKLGPCVSTETLGWSPSCQCAADTIPCTVLDPFAGAGTTGLVADRLQRNAILIELNPAYAEMGKRRITDDAPLFAAVDEYDGTDDFARSIDEAYRVIRERKAAGGKGWEPP